MESNISKNIELMLSKMEGFITSKSVIGEPIQVDDVIIVPLVDLSFGFGVGGTTKSSDPKKDSEAAGSGLGANLKPSAVLVIQNGNVQIINLKNQDSISKIIDMAPGIMNKLGVNDFFAKFKKSPKEEDIKKESSMDFKFEEEKIFEDGENIVEEEIKIEE